MTQQNVAPPAKPGIADPATRQALLEKARRGLLASKDKSAGPHISPRPAGVGNPLSFSQQRMWFLEQLTPGTAVHSIVSATRLTGELNVEAMARTLNEIVRRHDTLRATFSSVEGEAVQHIAPVLQVPLPVLDFTGEADPEAAAQAALTREAERPFDLETGPLFRAFLFRIANNHHILLVVLHHIISDGWSTAILSEEIQTLYSAYVRGQVPLLPDLPIQYSDVAHWQQEWLRGEGAQKQLAYWQKQVQDAPELLELPTDYPRPPQPDYRGGRVEFTIPSALLQAVKGMAQAENATPFMVLLAAFNVLLGRYSRQEDITVGYPVAGRTHTEMESLIGLFLNTLVLRTDLSGNPTFRDLVARVRDVTLEASQHQELPFEHLVKALHVERRMSHTPLFQVFFVSQNAPHQSNHLPGLTLSGVSAWSGAEPFDLSCYLLERGDQIEGELRYRRELFEEATMARMAHQFVTLLTHAIASPTAPIDALPLLTPAEAGELIQRWNQTEQAYPHLSLPALIAEQAHRTPNVIALITETEEITYERLLRRVTHIAHALKGAGVKAGDIVGLGVDRGANLVVGALGILQAGAAYLPLDPAYPAERLTYMLEDAGAEVVLTETHLRDTLPVGHAQPLYMDILLAHGASYILTPLPPPSADALAYIIYTSGSTGKPKGVQIAHAGLINFLRSMQKEPGLSADDTFLAIASLSFDIAGLELYLPLMIGGRVLMASRLQATDGYWLKSMLDSGAITVLQATPATWRLLLEAGWEGTPGLKMMVGAEPIPPALAEDLIQRGGELWNMYGPTETTVWSSVRQLTSRDITVGPPIDNLQYYVLDTMARPVPLGVPGELYIGGDGVAWGYRGKVALTADRFVPDPFSGKAGARLYRTGDVVRLRDDGSLIFVGRVDHQVKVRGFRIELGEIETAMELHPDTRQAIVVVRETQGHKQLVAYVVVNGTPPTPAEWRAHLHQYIPDYMIPAFYIAVPSMPLTLSGKVNRRALIAQSDSLNTSQEKEPVPHSHRPPRNPTEKILADIWAQVLRREHVGIEENFFDLGGDSILSLQIIARANRAGLALEPHQIFEYQTIAELGAVATAPVIEVPAPVPTTPTPQFSGARLNQGQLSQVMKKLKGKG